MGYSYPLYNDQGKELKKVDLSQEIFADEYINEGLIQQYIVMYLANKRYAIANTKTRGQVKRSGKKLFRQKGTGNARVGDAGSPIRRKGGVAFGPQKNANYSKSMPQKMKYKALLGALSIKARDGELYGLDAYQSDIPQTKKAYTLLSQLGLVTKKVLVVLSNNDEVVYKSMRNIPQTSITTAQKLNAYDLLTHRNVLFVGEAFEGLEERILGANNSK